MHNFASVFNPLNKNVIVHWDLSGKLPRTWTLKSKEITKIESTYEKHVRRALVDEMFNVKGNSIVSLNLFFGLLFISIGERKRAIALN